MSRIARKVEYRELPAEKNSQLTHAKCRVLLFTPQNVPYTGHKVCWTVGAQHAPGVRGVRVPGGSGALRGAMVQQQETRLRQVRLRRLHYYDKKRKEKRYQVLHNNVLNYALVWDGRCCSPGLKRELANCFLPMNSFQKKKIPPP